VVYVVRVCMCVYVFGATFKEEKEKAVKWVRVGGGRKWVGGCACVCMSVCLCVCVRVCASV